MRYFFSFILLSSILILSCRSEKQREGILPEKKMRVVLWDMTRADQFLTDFVFSRDTSINKLDESLKMYNRIFAIHQVTKEEFRQSFQYYREHPDLLKSLLDSVSNINVATVVSPVPDTAKRIQSAPQTAKPDSGKIKPFRGN